jgi:hypothetical protein
MKRKTLALSFALLAIATPSATAAVDPLDAATCHRHALSCPSHAGQPPTRIVTVERGKRFDWTDAAIGAGVALGAVFVAAGSVSLYTRSRHQQAVNPSSQLGT